MFKARRLMLLGVLIAAAVAIAACGSSSSSSDKASSSGGGGSSSSSQKTTKVSLLMNWFPQAEHGGYFEAHATGLDARNGVDFTILPGGPQIQTVPQVAAGKADFGVAQADQILQARAQGLPIVEVFAAFQKNPQCMLYHADQPISGFRDLNGHTVAISPDARTSYWAWMQPHFNLKVKTVNNPGTLSLFKQNDKLVQQCFVTSEPYYAKQSKIDAKALLIADGGYNPYANGLFTSEKFIKEHPDVVRKVVAAAKAGWAEFLRDPAKGKAAILAANRDADPKQIDFSVATMKKLDLVGSDPGQMTAARWNELKNQLVQAKVLKPSVDVSQAYTTRFLGG